MPAGYSRHRQKYRHLAGLPARRETCAEPGSAAEAGVSIMNSSQRRPVTGSDCSSEAGRVVVTAVETGSPCCEAV